MPLTLVFINNNFIFLFTLFIVYQRIVQPRVASMAIVTKMKTVCAMQGGLAQTVIFKPALLSVWMDIVTIPQDCVSVIQVSQVWKMLKNCLAVYKRSSPEAYTVKACERNACYMYTVCILYRCRWKISFKNNSRNHLFLMHVQKDFCVWPLTPLAPGSAACKYKKHILLHLVMVPLLSSSLSSSFKVPNTPWC